MSVRELFKIRREERWIAIVALSLFIALNALTVSRYFGEFTPLQKDYWRLFVTHFHISGFDPITYYVVSHWEARYNVFRHPLLSFLMWIPYIINQGCMALFGINCVQFLVALMVIGAAFYAFIFMHRICRDVLSLNRIESGVLSFLLFSFAYVMLSAMVPDHFILSLFALLLTLYVSGRLLQERRPMSILTTIGLFLLTAGISLNNGLKVFLSGWVINGRHFFKPRYLLFAVIFPSLLIWVGCRYEYRFFEAPHVEARHKAKARIAAERKKKEAQMQAAGVSKPKPAKKKQSKMGVPISNGEFMRWTDISTPRWSVAVENLFGESIQLHPDYLLQDVLRTRPVIVHYRWVFNYVVEALLVLLFLAGIWMGRRSRFLWICLSWFVLDMVLHMGLGFGINEVYIMSAHWIFILPIAYGYLLKSLSPRPRLILLGLLALLTLYLYVYNGYWVASYMLA